MLENVIVVLLLAIQGLKHAMNGAEHDTVPAILARIIFISAWFYVYYITEITKAVQYKAPVSVLKKEDYQQLSTDQNDQL